MAIHWFVCVLLCLLHGVSSESPSPSSCPHSDEIDDECLPGGKGFKTCQQEGNHGTFTVVKCKMPKTKCDCVSGYLMGLVDWVPRKCRCVDPTGHPSFPSTGYITWKGDETYRLYHWYYRPTETKHRQKIHGEAYRDDAGHFLLKYTSVQNWWGNDNDPAVMGEHLKIILPRGYGSFTKITRSNDGKCKEETVSATVEDFDFLWDDVLSGTWKADHYKKISEESSGSVKTQRWGGSYVMDTYDYSYGAYWDFYVDYNMRKGFALPKKFYKKVKEEEERTFTTNIKYEYKEGIKEIKLEDYCP